ALDVPPPGAGLTTGMCAVPVWAMSAAGILAIRALCAVKVVGPGLPSQLTTEPLYKPSPSTTTPKSAPPAVTAAGARRVRAARALTTAKETALETPPPPPTVGLKTVMLAVVGVAISV